jgi:hypothetical protein
MSRSLSSGAHSRDPAAHAGYWSLNRSRAYDRLNHRAYVDADKVKESNKAF